MADSSYFFNGPILTMDDDLPTAEALLVDDGVIVAVGPAEVVSKHRRADTKDVDLGGKTLLPGFVDAHSHFMNALQAQLWADLRAAPEGPVSSVADIIAELQDLKERMNAKPGDWLVGVGYTEQPLPEGRHVTINDLDHVFPDNPVMLFHYTNHGCVLNSAGLKAYEIHEGTVTPDGGIIERLPGGTKPAGFVFDMAFAPIHGDLPQAPAELMDRALQEAQTYYASKGISTAHEGGTRVKELRYLTQAAARGALFLDLNTLPFFLDAEQTLDDPDLPWNRYENRLRCAGLKVICDGSAMALTAFFTQPYESDGPSGERNWCGESIAPQEVFNQITQAAYQRQIPVFTHANGDAAIDMAITAHREAEPRGAQAGRRPVVVHSQFVRRDQLDTYVELGMVPTMFTNHTYYFADQHRKLIGRERTDFLSPMRSAIDRGLLVSNHSDAAVTPLDPMMNVWTAVNRVSIGGEVIGPDERITVLEALKAVTTWSAYTVREEATKGLLRVGMLADLVVLDSNPLAVDPMALKDIRPVATYKEGVQVYSAE